VHRGAGDHGVAEAEVGSSAGVAHDGDLESQLAGGAGRGVDAHAAHHADDDELGDALIGEQLLQARSDEAVGLVLLEHDLVAGRRDERVDADARRARHEEGRVGLGRDVKDVHDRLAGCAEAVENRARRGGRGVWLDKRKSASVEVIELDVDDEESASHAPSMTPSVGRDRSGASANLAVVCDPEVCRHNRIRLWGRSQSTTQE
jgi:hypothetical protein